MANLAKSAVWYARHGWAVFPLVPRTKIPYAGQGVYEGTTDTDKVMDWWRRHPNANIGLHCGASGLLGIDLDNYKDAYKGERLLTPDDEQTITNLTGSGGTHLIYSIDDGKRYGNRTGNLPAGIDVRGWGGYLVLPPSIHPNGNVYQWEAGYGPHEIEPLPLPDKLRETLEQARGIQRVAGPPNTEAVAIARDIVLAVIDAIHIDTFGEQDYDGCGRKWVLKHCPFNPADDPHKEDRGAYILITRDGNIAAGCQHERCRRLLNEAKLGGWKYLLRKEAIYA